LVDIFADIIVNISHEKVDRPFQYCVPEALKEQVTVGACVMVPFGNGNKLTKGYVVDIGEQCNFDLDRMKNIHSVVLDSVGAESRQIQIAAWIRQQFGGTMIQALKTVLPVKQTVKQKEYKKVVLTADREETIAYLGECLRDKRRSASVRIRFTVHFKQERAGAKNGSVISEKSDFLSEKSRKKSIEKMQKLLLKYCCNLSK